MKQWDVMVDGQAYHVEVKGGKVTVNNEVMKLKNLQKERKMHYGSWEIPLGPVKAILYGPGSLTSVTQRLVIDGKDCLTGEDYHPMEKIPAWVYIFVVIHAINFANGAVGAMLAIAGITMTMGIAANEKMNMAVKVLLSIALVAGSAFIVFGIAYTTAGLIYG